MVAGLNLKVDVIQINNDPDDNIGGAIVTGTTRYANMPAVLTPRRPSQVMLEQGLETDNVYDFTCAGRFYRQRVVIYERDEILVTWPLNHALYDLKFRVTGVQPGRGRTKNSALHCTLSRIVTSRSRQ